MWLRTSWIIVPVALLGAAAAVAITLTMQPVYESETVILLDRPSQGRLDNAADSVRLDSAQRSATIRSQIEILRGNDVVYRVIDKLHLDREPMFNPAPSATAQLTATVMGWLGLHPSAAPAGPAVPMETRLAPIYLDHLAIRQDADTYILHIGFRGPDPALAARIVNAHVDAYAEWTRQQQTAAITGAADWLKKAVSSAHDRVVAAEQAVQAFNKNGVLTNVEGRTPLDQGLAELTTQLASAQAALVKAEARSNEIHSLQRAGQSAGIAAMSGSKVLEGLQSDYEASLSNAAGTQGNYGSRYPSVVQGTAHNAEAKAAIQRELTHFVEGQSSQVNIARATVVNLTAALDQMKQQVIAAGSDRSKLARLEGEASAERNNYLGLLQKLRSYDNVEALARADMTVLSPAVPAGAPSSPRRGLFAVFGFLLAGGTASGAMVWRVSRRDVVRHTSDTTALTGARCLGIMPEMRIHGRRGDIDRQHMTYSFFREEMRSICAGLVRDNGDRRAGGISVMVTSPLPGEGKSTFCYELGRFAAQSGVPTLIVRTDRTSTGLNSRGRPGRAAASSKAEPEQPGVVQLEDGLPLYGEDWLAPDAVIGGNSLERSLSAWQRAFGLVIFDTPPVSAMAEGVILAPLTDSTIVLARIDRTPRSLLTSVTAQIERAGGKLAGIVLTFVQLDSQRGMEPSDPAYYFNQNRDYHRRLTAIRASERV